VAVIQQNAELRDGSLTGERAMSKEIDRIKYVPVAAPFIPRWIWWVLGVLGLWWLLKFLGPRYREMVWAAIKALFSLRLPLTLAIMPCLLLGSGDQRYAIPQRELEEIVLLEPDVAEAFPNDEAVNQALRGVLNTARAVRGTGGLADKSLQPAVRRRARRSKNI
jgi:hypothetical protein